VLANPPLGFSGRQISLQRFDANRLNLEQRRDGATRSQADGTARASQIARPRSSLRIWRDALCRQILGSRLADYRDCGGDSDDDATHASHLKSANGVAPNFVHALDAIHLADGRLP
jgi:hypothetical protein